MARKRKRNTTSPRAGRSARNKVVDSPNRVIARFSDRLVFGEVSDQRRKRLVLVTPDPPDAVAAQHPEIKEMMERAARLLFQGTGLSTKEEQMVLLALRRLGFSAFNALMEHLNRIPLVQDQIEELAARGVDRNDLVAAIAMVPEELQRKAAKALPGAKQPLGQSIGRLKSYVASGHKLKIDPIILRALEADVDFKIQVKRRVQEAIDKFLAATKDLMGATKTPLVRDLRVRVAHLLLDRGLLPGEAFRTTTCLLRAWHPERFTGLTDIHVRRAYERQQSRRVPR